MYIFNVRNSKDYTTIIQIHDTTYNITHDIIIGFDIWEYFKNPLNIKTRTIKKKSDYTNFSFNCIEQKIIGFDDITLNMEEQNINIISMEYINNYEFKPVNNINISIPKDIILLIKLFINKNIQLYTYGII